MKKNVVKKEIAPYILLLCAALFILFSTNMFGGKTHELSYSEFEKNLQSNK